MRITHTPTGMMVEEAQNPRKSALYFLRLELMRALEEKVNSTKGD